MDCIKYIYKRERSMAGSAYWADKEAELELRRSQIPEEFKSKHTCMPNSKHSAFELDAQQNDMEREWLQVAYGLLLPERSAFGAVYDSNVFLTQEEATVLGTLLNAPDRFIYGIHLNPEYPRCCDETAILYLYGRNVRSFELQLRMCAVYVHKMLRGYIEPGVAYSPSNAYTPHHKHNLRVCLNLMAFIVNTKMLAEAVAELDQPLLVKFRTMFEDNNLMLDMHEEAARVAGQLFPFPMPCA